jgi:chromosome segregation ATPase
MDRLLITTGKSTDDLKASVELHQRRVALHAQMDRLPEIEKERAKISKQFAEARAVLDAAEAKYEETAGPLRGRSEFLKQEASAAGDAKQKLVDCCPYDELLAELQEVYAQKKDAHDRRSKLHSEIQMYREHARSLRTQSGEEPSVKGETRGSLRRIETRSEDSRKQALEQRAAHHEAKVAQLTSALAEAEKEVAALDKREGEVLARMREP